MVRIALLFPTQGFFKEAQEIFSLHCQFQREYEAVSEEYVLNELAVPFNAFDSKVFTDYDVIISRGITAELFRRQFHQIPLVEIPVVGNDLVRAMLLLHKEYRGRLCAVIGAHNMVYGAEELAEILEMEVRCYERHTNQDWCATVDQAIADGCSALLGGVETCAYGRKRGLPCQLIETGKEALWQAFTEAKKMVQVQQEEQKKTQRYKTILDYTYEGVLEISADGMLVSFNHAARNILNLQDEMCGKEIHLYLAHTPFRDLLLGAEDCENALAAHGPLQLAVNKSKLKSNSSIWGYLITFQDVTKLQQMEKSIRKQQQERGHVARYHFEDILGSSLELRYTIEQAQKYAAVDVDILITGQSGTGKELFAQSIHNASDRASQPFVAVNCAALNENLLESELFGYVEGAFTGALRGGKKGLFEQAHGGTIFLDEIAEISLFLQCKLLRVLQEREVMRLGDDKIIPLDIRVIAATNKNLLDYIRHGKFREDLYYRLDQLRVNLPSLNERTGDIPILAQHFIDRYAVHYRRNIPQLSLTEAAMELLSRHQWTGNIRELKNICLRIAITCRGARVDVEDLKAVLQDAPWLHDDHQQENTKQPQLTQSRDEREEILQALQKTGYNRTQAAALLKLSRSTLWKRMKQYGL